MHMQMARKLKSVHGVYSQHALEITIFMTGSAAPSPTEVIFIARNGTGYYPGDTHS